MTKEQKIEKVRQVMKQTYPNMHAMAGKIVSALEEPEERFLENEVVSVWGGAYFGLYKDVKKHKPLDEISKLTPEILAATVGTWIPGAKWAAVDKDNMMYWYEDEPRFSSRGDFSRWHGDLCYNPDGYAYNIPCLMPDWTKAKWRLE